MSKNSVDVLNRAIIEAARSDLEIFTQLAFAELKESPFSTTGISVRSRGSSSDLNRETSSG
ncbi:MAG: hypothetical protein IPP45_16255 [Sphingomonadales bacterium]|nr:hypothetical protein [Sphingomonadales bacterium]